MRNNWIYVLYRSFSVDLLFWIVIDNLFLTTVKGFETFQIVLVTMLGIGGSIILYPLTNIIVKKTSAKTSVVLGALCYCISSLMFLFCSTIVGITIGQVFYYLASPFSAVSNVILKNNLVYQNKENDYVKWQSYGKLGYAIITLAISLCAGVLFNVNAYLPVVLSFVCAVVGLIMAILYKDVCIHKNAEESSNIKSVVTEKTMIFVMLMNLIAVGTYIFLQGKATLLIQNVCELEGIEVSQISIIVSAIVFGSRLVRVLADLAMPKIYSKIKNKSNVLIVIGLLILISNIFFAVGGNINTNIILKLALIAIGFYIILSVRDAYSITESKIITTNLPENKQKQAFVLANIYGQFGRLLVNIFALIILGFMPLSTLYIFMLILSVVQIFVCIPLSKYLKS